MANNTGEITVDGITVDPKKAENILRWLIRREAENVRTKAHTDVQMISDIQKHIKEEAECY
jgi:hypothetical protein